MKLSIIVPVYNVEDFLPACLDGVLKQQVESDSYEIIVVNDGSPDNSLKIAEQYQQQYSQIKIISQQNGGIAAARNTGIHAAAGEYVVMLDSDDFYSADFFQEIYNIIDEEAPDMILLDYNFYYSQDNKHEKVKRMFKPIDINGKKGDEVLDAILNQEPMYTWYPWAYIIKRSLITEKDLFFVPRRNYEDIMWTPLLFLYAEKLWYFDKAVLEYRLQRDGQITGTVNYKNIADPIFAPDYILDRIKKIEVKPKLKQKILENISSKYFYAFIYAGRLNNNERNQLVRLLQDYAHLLKYSQTTLSKLIKWTVKLLGVKKAVSLFKIVDRSYRLVKKRKQVI